MKKNIVAVIVICLMVAGVMAFFKRVDAKNGGKKQDEEVFTAQADEQPSLEETYQAEIDQKESEQQAFSGTKAEQNIEYNAALYVNSSQLYENCCRNADERQRARLKELEERYHLLTYEHTKEILQIMGLLPEELPRLKMEQVIGVMDTLRDEEWQSPAEFEKAAVKCLNEFAGAPDLDGGSGISYRTYYLNEDKTEYISVSFGMIIYCKDGMREILLTCVE